MDIKDYLPGFINNLFREQVVDNSPKPQITHIKEIVNVDKKTPNKAIINKSIVKEQLFRIIQDINRWRTATSIAESVQTPDRTELIRVYKDVIIDGHLSALMNVLELSVVSSDFNILNSNSEIDEDESGKFKKKWFRDFMTLTIRSKFYGYQLIQLGDIINNEFKWVKGVPYEFIIPEKRAVKKHLSAVSSASIFFDNPPYKNWTIFIGEPFDLGLLHKATPLVLWKKNVMSSWSEHAEIFAMPLRIGKTNIIDPLRNQNMYNMLENMGSAAFAVIDKDDDVELRETSKTDAYKIYQELKNCVNSELSKLFLGQTGTTDEKAHVGAAQVHENVLLGIVQAWKQFTADIINNELIPRMIMFGMVKDGTRFEHDDTESFDKMEMFEMVKSLLLFYDIDPKIIEEEFGIKVESKVVTESMFENKSIMAEVTALYKEAYGKA